MSYKCTLIKFAIKQTPKKMVFWLANKKTKGIVQLTDYNFNLEEQKLYAQIQLAGEPESIELMLEDFSILTYEESCRLVIHQVQSNRPWLQTLLTNYVLGREWKVPAKHTELIHELLASKQAENLE